MATIAPTHPGEVLLEEFLVPLEVTQHRLAVSIGVPPRQINEIVHGKRRITADTALRLARFFAHLRPVLAQPSGSLRPEIERTTSAAPSKTSSRYRAPDPHA